MQHVSVHEAKTHLSRLLKKVAAGEEIIITSSGKPVAALMAPPKPKKRISGDMKDKFVMPDDFDQPMPDEWFETDEYPQE
ncbi:MAG: type II toxin-antitoxin system Phd/YefM family antitoxin [Alphaproteobacteria bacterium]|nr:type II toxin-antitoxin system Phd/YefM family antitoxin [Alphaproteobacteria bacterium]